MDRCFLRKGSPALPALLAVLLLLPSAASSARAAKPAGSAPSEADTKRIEWLERRVELLEQRIDRLEPRVPTTIVRLPVEAEAEKLAPRDAVPISEVLRRGKEIPFRIVKHDPNFVRPVYLWEWHSRFGRWSYMPSRVHYALHRLFAAYDFGLSALYQLQGDLGVAFPTFQHETNLDLYLIAFQTEVRGAYTLGNQIVLVGSPKRTGVQVVTVKTGDLQPSDKGKLLLAQLATAGGEEIDYALVAYAPPDFWAQQRRR